MSLLWSSVAEADESNMKEPTIKELTEMRKAQQEIAKIRVKLNVEEANKGERVRWNKQEREAIKAEEKRIQREKTLAFVHVHSPPEKEEQKQKETPAIHANLTPEKVQSPLKASTESVTKFLEKWEMPRESKESYEGIDFIDYYIQQRKKNWGKIELPVLLELYQQKGIQKTEKNLAIIKASLSFKPAYAPVTDVNDFLNLIEWLASDRDKLKEFMQELMDEIEFLLPLTNFKSDVAYTWVQNFKATIDNLAKILDAKLKAQLQACLESIEDYLTSPTTILEEE